MMENLTIRVNEELLQDLNDCAAEYSMSTQQYLTELIEANLYPERFPQLRKGLRDKILDALEMVEEGLDDVRDALQEFDEQIIDDTEMTMKL